LWCPFGGDDLPRDQREELEAAVFRETPVANAPQSVLGHAIVRLRLASDRPMAHVVLRLCDVAPDGAMLLVARGVLNLCHRGGHARVELLAPGRLFEATVQLDCAAHRLAEGHRWQLAIAPSYWPMIWPSPEPVTLTVHGAELVLPIRRPSPLDDALPPFGVADGAAPLAIETLSPPQRSSDRRASTDAVDIETMHDYGRIRLPDGLEIHARARHTSHIALAQTVDARIDAARDVSLARGDWRVRVRIDATLRTDQSELVLEQRLEAFEGDTQVRRKEWATRLPRDGV
jgi:predicted acyl esterase